ncbi:glycosyltransferase [Vibrio vulnificus]|nr:glycosyltransferase [Vibrio vulnificus]ELQ2465495.1 glycosyltransferase [Vibrio vulnificus]
MKVVAIVPTYNRPELLLKNLNCLLKQTVAIEKIILVDNASDSNTKEILDRNALIGHEKILYHRLDVNQGASGGFKTAMQLAMEFKPDWIWGMDDDAFPREDALENLLSSLGHFDANDNVVLWSNCDEDTDFTNDYKKVEHFMFVGFFIPIELIQKIGYPDTNFYMYHDDTEYSARIIRAGYSINKIRNSIIDHKGYDKRGPSPFLDFNIFGKSVRLYNFEGYRVYYILRNQYYVSGDGFLSKARYHKYMIFNIFKYLALKPSLTKYVLLAYCHIITGRRGKVL